MAVFKYVAYDSNGKKVESTIEAESVAEAQSSLKQSSGLLVSSISPLSGGSVKGLSGLFKGDGIGGRELEYLTSEIRLLLGSGVKFDKAIELLARAKSGSNMGNILSSISTKLKSGSTISDAFGQFSKLFNRLYVNLIKTGEESGTLEAVFAGLARDLKYRNDLRQVIVQACTYPSIVLLVCLASIVFIFNFIVPKLAVLFEGAAELSFNTRMILAISDWMISYQNYVAMILMGLLIAGYYYRGNPQLLSWFHSRSRSMAVVGQVVEMTERIRFCSSVSLLLQAGIAMDQAVKLSAGNAINSEVRRELENVSDKIRKGALLSQSLSETTLFPPLYISLIEIGEESGEVARIFQELADRGRNEFTQWVGRLTSLLEPILILTMGVIVGGVVISMMMSVMSVNEAVV